MRKVIVSLMSILLSSSFFSCSKNVSDEESAFYGTWVKGSNTGDTLQFSKKNGKNILSYNLSFNSLVYAPTEVEYFYTNGRLSIKYPAVTGADFPINSFVWKQGNKEFEVLGIELYNFMSASNVFFTFRKL